MKWLAITFGDDDCASTLHRIRQYLPLLSEMGFELVPRLASDLKKLGDLNKMGDFHTFDGVFLQKKLLLPALCQQIARSGLPMIFDTDDATWQPHNKRHAPLTRYRMRGRLKLVATMAARVLASNDHLAQQLRPYNANVEIFPMTLPQADWMCSPPSSGPVVVGWAGAPHNHFHLMHIAEALQEVKRAHPEVVLRIFSGTPPPLSMDFDFVAFDPGRQAEVLRSFSIGLLPMPDTPFNHGKSPIKALQYMASGIPCVASALSGTQEILGSGECGFYASDTKSWVDHLLSLIRDAQLRQRLGEQARKRYEAHFTTEAAAVRLAAILRQTARQPCEVPALTELKSSPA